MSDLRTLLRNKLHVGHIRTSLKKASNLKIISTSFCLYNSSTTFSFSQHKPELLAFALVVVMRDILNFNKHINKNFETSIVRTEHVKIVLKTFDDHMCPWYVLDTTALYVRSTSHNLSQKRELSQTKQNQKMSCCRHKNHKPRSKTKRKRNNRNKNMARRSSFSSTSSMSERSVLACGVTIGLEYNEVHHIQPIADEDVSTCWYTLEECNESLQNDDADSICAFSHTSSPTMQLRKSPKMKTLSIEAMSGSVTTHHNLTRRRAIDAVRKEQRRQSLEGIHDDELLALIYQGYNVTSIQSARRRAQRDACTAASQYC